ncbi:hypothetical protein B296_00013287 [Ensete ventricosum]|uniref:Uncharacterized protein n=1 Tax=Ensete ventricosum TaxID=4639 RepID=A0A426ZCS3_ENSVE|nr:hypothetical protein B296_00013287 [Ensete ventricosum]
MPWHLFPFCFLLPLRRTMDVVCPNNPTVWDGKGFTQCFENIYPFCLLCFLCTCFLLVFDSSFP